MPSITVNEPNKAPATLPLEKDPFVIGRNPAKCDLAFESLGISSTHCSISKCGEAYKLTDLNSSNHTYVNGRMVSEHFLNHNDRIALGVIAIVFANENQKPPPQSAAKTPAAGTPGVAPPPKEEVAEPTFFMDGEKLRKKLEMVRSGTSTPAITDGGEAAPAPQQKIGATAKDYANAFNKDEAKPASSGAGKFVLGLLLGLMIGAAVAVGVALYLRH